jgi:Ca2+-binding EF-hand superfamily protein
METTLYISTCHELTSLFFISTGEKSYKFEEFIPLYKELMNEKDTGTFADFMEAFKTFDREGQGFISGAELRHLLTSLGKFECLSRMSQWPCNGYTVVSIKSK